MKSDNFFFKMPVSGPKGIKKRAAYLFKAGHKVRPARANTQHQQPRRQQESEVKSTKGGSFLSFEESVERRLRPKRVGEPEIENDMRLVHQKKANELWNSSIQEHSRKSKRCRRPEFTQAQEGKWGLAISQSLKCLNCNYRSKTAKLYEEIKLHPGRGRKSAAPNVALGAALKHTSIGIEKARDIFSAIDLPVPSASAMQKLAVHVSKVTTTVAQRGCNEKIELVSGEDRTIGLKADCRYNTARLSTSRRTGLNQTSQGVTVFIEDKSGENFIVAAHVQNKVCIQGTKMRAKGLDVQCPGHDGCTATVRRMDSLSEKVAGESVGKQFVDMGITVTHITTDGDAQCAKGLQEVTPTPVKALSDTTHLAQTQLRRGRSAEWSDNMFAGVKQKGTKSLCTQALAKDLKRRCVIVLRTLHKKHKGKLDDIQQEAALAVKAIIMCYQGDCEHCNEKIVTACLGGKEGEDSWVTRSSFLQEQKIDCLQMTNKDVLHMTGVLNMLLGQDSLETTQLLTNTQACEAANRAFSVTLPKNKKFSRTLEGRLSAAVEDWNQGPGKAVFRQHTELGLTTTKGQLRYLKKKQDRKVWKKKYNKSPTTLQLRRKNDYFLRSQKKDWTSGIKSDYKTHQLDDIPDHNYTKTSVSTFTDSVPTHFTTNSLKNLKHHGHAKIKNVAESYLDYTSGVPRVALACV